MSSRWSDWSKWSILLLRVWGIPIRLHASIALIIPFFFIDFHWAQALVYGVVNMFISISLHELGHCFVALRKGCRVNEILLLFPIGGVARMDRIPARPRDEALMAIAGPAVSLFLFVVLFFGGWIIPLGPAQIGGQHMVLNISSIQIAPNIIQVLGLANLVLFAFNLVPAFPMDGGRILRAWLSSRMGRLQATFVAALLGKAGAVILLLVGLRFEVWTLGIIAAFVYFLAGKEYRAVAQQEGLKAFGLDPTGDQDSDEWHDRAVIGPPPYRASDRPSTAAPIVRDHKRGGFHFH